MWSLRAAASRQAGRRGQSFETGSGPWLGLCRSRCVSLHDGGRPTLAAKIRAELVLVLVDGPIEDWRGEDDAAVKAIEDEAGDEVRCHHADQLVVAVFGVIAKRCTRATGPGRFRVDSLGRGSDKPRPSLFTALHRRSPPRRSVRYRRS